MLLQNQRTARESYDLSALLETHRGLLSVQEHREATLTYDVGVVKSDAMTNPRTPIGSGDQRALFETSWFLLRAISLSKNTERRH